MGKFQQPHLRAEMAELVDALASGASVLMDVGVRVSLSAPCPSIGSQRANLGDSKSRHL